MRDALEILKEFNDAHDTMDMLAMVDLIKEMSQVDPCFVELMMNVMYGEE